MEKFEKLGMSNEILEALNKIGFKEPTEIQEKAIPLALAGKDIIGGSATGSGKTLAFASAIIQNINPDGKVKSLILTPTRELAEQVADSIREFSMKKKLNVNAIYGGVDIKPQIRLLSHTDIVVGTPGRILDHLNRRTLDLSRVKFLVLDEVDRMFDMGFYRDVERILYQCPKNRQTMMFSATISSDINSFTKKHTKDPVTVSVNSYLDSSKIKQIYYDVPSTNKFSLLVHLLKNEDTKLAMVFCSTRRNVDFLTNNLKRLGINSEAIHGGLSQNKRTRTLNEFHSKGISVLICTDIAARGLDIKEVSHVYNYDISPTNKEYIHRIGRTARAGCNGEAISILSNRDYENFRSILKDDSLKIDRQELPVFDIVFTQSDDFRRRRYHNPRNDRHMERNNFKGRTFNKRFR
ncbi:MAG TPA: DEAD/DEAH box helicase [Candidatus Nanoarchaeia archaeon]|nr:DEAD/DEAH box helicase [Candidatus Nanoarchaeia archaeon]